jgi:Lhr-like helicase
MARTGRDLPLRPGRDDARILSVLYISPLKALNEVYAFNLSEPVGSRALVRKQKARRFGDSGSKRGPAIPRHGRRRRFHRGLRPSATTPESLAILLVSPRARAVLRKSGCHPDEVHAVLEFQEGPFSGCQVGRFPAGRRVPNGGLSCDRTTP